MERQISRELRVEIQDLELSLNSCADARSLAQADYEEEKATRLRSTESLTRQLGDLKSAHEEAIEVYEQNLTLILTLTLIGS